MAYQLEEINRRLKEDPAGFVAECDGVYQKRLETAAGRILERMKESPIVLLSGPSGSGKTTTALKLEQELERRGVQTHTISMDNYFKTLNRKTAPRNAEGDIDYESPRLLDMDLLDDTFTKLSRGEWVIVPKFEFARQMRNDSRGTLLKLDKNEIAIFEGIHALNDDIAGRHPEATTLYISARSDILEGEALLRHVRGLLQAGPVALCRQTGGFIFLIFRQGGTEQVVGCVLVEVFQQIRHCTFLLLTLSRLVHYHYNSPEWACQVLFARSFLCQYFQSDCSNCEKKQD